ncbi:integrase [Streptomyces reniochalinae]|uniref:Integrase n=1 Tax=Streptomyces reniochalinae TaxID=2250578 RepID=A0A367E6T3_9ACTN|nr:integrase [Streptomyces reniochalinae]RCG13776.1 integrase [Streptomyces reniochalinae]
MTREELLSLPVAVDLDTANRALTIGRSTGYQLAKRGEYPVKVLRLGNAYRVVTEELHQLLGVQSEQEEGRAQCA